MLVSGCVTQSFSLRRHASIGFRDSHKDKDPSRSRSRKTDESHASKPLACEAAYSWPVEGLANVDLFSIPDWYKPLDLQEGEFALHYS